MNPPNSQPQNGQSLGFSSSNVDVPPIPGMGQQPQPAQAPLDNPAGEVQPTVAPEVVSAPPLTSSEAAPSTPQAPLDPMPAAPPPPPSSPPPPPQQSNVVSGGSKRGFPKILIILLVLILGLAAIFFLVTRLMSGGAGTQAAELTWWGLWEEEATVAPIIADYEAQNPGVTVKYVKQSKEDYRERLASALASGQGPDIFTMHNTWVPMFANSLSPIPSSVMSAQTFAEKYYPVMVSDLTRGSSIVGLPTGYDGLGLFINDEIFTTYGKNPPTTWNQLRDLASEMTIRESGVIKQSGVALGNAKNVDHWPEILALLMIQNGVDLKEPTGDLAEQVVTFYTQFQNTDQVWDETLPSSTLAFAGGKLAMMIAPSWRVHEVKQINPSLNFRVIPVPQLEKLSPDEPDITYASYWVSSVSSRSKSSAQAWSFVNFISSRETLEKLYAQARNIRAFGQPYPLVEMRNLISDDPFVGGIISYAGNARSWYLASRTWDGQTGINSKLNKYFEDAINSLTARAGASQQIKGALDTVSLGVNQVLSEYGLATPIPVPVN